MAETTQAIIAIILLFNVMILNVIAARDIQSTNIKKHEDVKHPESFIKHDRGYLIPGVGRGIKPKCKDRFNPFTYNPVTGDNNGIHVSFPGVGGVRGGSNVRGGDDTFVPNPRSRGSPPGPASP